MRVVQVAVGHRRCASFLARGPLEQQKSSGQCEEKERYDGMFSVNCMRQNLCRRGRRKSEEVLGECLEWRQLQKCY